MQSPREVIIARERLPAVRRDLVPDICVQPRNSRARVCVNRPYNSCIYIAYGLAEIYGGETDAIAGVGSAR